MATEQDEALYDGLETGDPLAVRDALPDDEGDEEDPYLHKVRRAGGFRQYEAQVTKSLVEIFEPKFPKLPAEVIRTIVAFWAHVGDY